MNLTDHLPAAGAMSFIWGHSDCCLMPSDWMKTRTGIDPAAPLRGRYGTTFGDLRHITDRGGFVQMVRDLMRDACFAETVAPAPGDVGIVMQPSGFVLAIKTALRLGREDA